MDDATKAYAKPLSWSDPDHYPDNPESNPNLDSPTVPEPAGKSESTGEKPSIAGFMNNNEILKKTLASLLAIVVAIGGMAHANPTMTLDVRDASSIEANTIIRPGVVAYGLGYHDGIGGDPNLDTLKQYLDATSSSVGDVIISPLGQQLRKLNKLTGDPDFDVELDDLLSWEIQDVIDAVNARQAGGRVQMKISCSLPDHLSLYPGVRHDAQSGLLHPTEHPISACGPIDPTTQRLDNGKMPQEEWASIMEKVAARYQNQNVYFVIGDEPENYFNGTFEQFLSFAKYTASGLRSGNPDIEIGIGIGDLQTEEMRRTNPVFVPEDSEDPFDDPNGHYEMTTIKYEKPLIDQYLEYIHNNQLDKIDAIQYKQFNKSPFPASTAFWHKNATYIDNLIDSLGPTNEATNGPVKLMVTDYPNWHTTCSDDIEAIGEWIDGESIWDSEYMAAMYTSAYLGMADFNHQNFESGSLNNIELITPHLAFLVNWGVDTFFHSSCEADGSSPAGFGGSIALNSKLADIPKPIAHVLNILDALDGKLMRVTSSDDNLFAYSGYKSQNAEQPESVTLVVSHFVPTEGQVNTYERSEGLPTYEFGHLWKNDHGVTTPLSMEPCEHFSCQDPLKICCTAQEFQDMVYDPNGHFPRNMTKALIVDNANPNDWGLPAPTVDRILAVQAAGQANRALPSTLNVDIVTKGLAPSTRYLFSLNTIDDVTGNAYTDRYALNTQLETEWDVCKQTYCVGKTGLEYQICMRLCMKPVLELIQSQYSFTSTTVHTNVPVWTNESGELYLTLSDVKKNSVHLINITSAGDPGDPPGPSSNPDPADAATAVSTSAILSWTAGSDTDSHEVYFGASSPPAGEGNQAGTSFDPGPLAYATTYYWRIDEVNAEGTTTGAEWSFTTEAAPVLPGPSSNPDPADTATAVSITSVLGWTAGSDTDSHDVYFGASSPPAGEGNQADTSFDPGPLDYSTTYYWRIDEVNADGTTTGAEWSFTTEASSPVDTAVHVDALTGSSTPGSRGRRWTASVQIDVVDPDITSVSGVVVDGSWSNGASGGASCITNASGQCSVSKSNLKSNVASVVFSVDNLSGTDFSYDSGDNVVSQVTVLKDGGGDNLLPNAVNDSYITTVDVAVGGNVLDNDDEGDAPATVTSHDGTSAQGVSISVSASGSFDYTPPGGYEGVDSFGYTITDSNGDSDSATVSITIDPAGGNLLPDAVDDNHPTDQDAAFSANVMDNDDEGDAPATVTSHDPLSAQGVLISIGSSGAFTYTPPASYTGPDSFAYTLTDDNGDSDTATVFITINPVGSELTLSVSKLRDKGTWYGILSWSGGVGDPTVTITRNTVTVAGSPTANDGEFSDQIGKKVSGDFEYEVCDSAGCASDTVSF